MQVDPAFTRYVAAQHALGKTDVDIGNMLEALAANTAAAAGDPAKEAKLAADHAKLATQSDAALAVTLGVQGTPQASAGQAVAAWRQTGSGAVGAKVAAATATAGAGAAAAGGATSPAPAVSPSFQRWVDQQHALGRSDADIGAGFDNLAAQVAATEGDPAGRAQLDANLDQLANESNAAYLDELGVKTNNGRQGVSPTAVVEAYNENGGGVVGQAIKVRDDDRTYRYGAPPARPAPAVVVDRGADSPATSAPPAAATSPVIEEGIAEASAVEDARLVRQAAQARADRRDELRAAQRELQRSIGAFLAPSDKSISFFQPGRDSDSDKLTSVKPTGESTGAQGTPGSSRRYPSVSSAGDVNGQRYTFTVTPYLTKGADGQERFGLTISNVKRG